MPEKTIANVAGVWGEAATVPQTIEYYINGSGGTLLPGDVVIASGVAGTTITTVAGADSKKVVGVVASSDSSLRTVASTETIAAGAICPVVVHGPARVNIAANAVADGATLQTSAAAKVADDSAAVVGAGLGTALESQATKDANNTIVAFIKSS